jgi:hypothetical protein
MVLLSKLFLVSIKAIKIIKIIFIINIYNEINIYDIFFFKKNIPRSMFFLRKNDPGGMLCSGECFRVKTASHYVPLRGKKKNYFFSQFVSRTRASLGNWLRFLPVHAARDWTIDKTTDF